MINLSRELIDASSPLLNVKNRVSDGDRVVITITKQESENFALAIAGVLEVILEKLCEQEGIDLDEDDDDEEDKDTT